MCTFLMQRARPLCSAGVSVFRYFAIDPAMVSAQEKEREKVLEHQREALVEK